MSIEQTTIDTIRTLSMDAVQAANSGHPGTPMALAPVAYELWANHLRYDPLAPRWPNRDRAATDFQSGTGMLPILRNGCSRSRDSNSEFRRDSKRRRGSSHSTV